MPATNVTGNNHQLLLELEMDEEVNDIINFPEKYANTFLDVTVIKPKENRLYTTEKKIMSGEQVKRFIQAVNEGKSREYAKGDHVKMPFFNEPDNDNVQLVYDTPDLNTVFKCKKRQNLNEKSSPCACKNCAVIGLVTDSQKRPFVTESIKDPSDTNKRRNFTEEMARRRKENDHLYCQYYFKYLSEKIRVLEDRVAAQEQRAVPKDYFKKIITKLLNHFSKAGYGGQIKIETSPEKSKSIHRQQKVILNPVLIQNKQQEDSPTGLWKWKEDLKNKLICVIEDTLNNLKKSKEKPKEEELKLFINEFSNNLYKTINDENSLNASCNFNERLKRRKCHRNRSHMQEPISVTYVNSQILKWQETHSTFRFDSDNDSLANVLEKKKTQEMHKIEFLKLLKKTKDDDKRRLWESIREQAGRNGYNKYNRVTVQIPDKNNPRKECMIEVEYTLGDLECLLLGNKDWK